MRNITLRDFILRGLWCIMAGTLNVACGDNGPTSPGNQTPPPTPAVLTGSTGIIFAADETFCTAKTPAWGFFGPTIISTVILTSGSSGERLGRSESGRLGDIELRLVLAETNAGDLPITGSIRGTAIDLLSSITFPNPNRVAVADGVLNGNYSTRTGGVVGRVSGSLVYTDNQGGTMTCSQGTWLLVPRNAAGNKLIENR